MGRSTPEDKPQQCQACKSERIIRCAYDKWNGGVYWCHDCGAVLNGGSLYVVGEGRRESQ